jgi:replication-associated recombination protein RarA
MNTATLTEQTLQDARRQRAEGKNLRTIAANLGVTWQKLEKALRHGLREDDHPPAPAKRPQTRKPAPALGLAAALVEKYRPRRLQDLCGQDRAVESLRTFASQPYSISFLFEGETGTGKTSAALALAAELGCGVEQQELGGVWTIASGEQSAEAVRATCEMMWHMPMYGSGWRVIIVNEADRMHAAAETIWLDRLEALPPRTVVVFTTNHTARLSKRFRDRCQRIEFACDAGELLGAARDLVARVLREETGADATMEQVEKLIATATDEAGQLSFRRLLQAAQLELMNGRRS